MKKILFTALISLFLCGGGDANSSRTGAIETPYTALSDTWYGAYIYPKGYYYNNNTYVVFNGNNGDNIYIISYNHTTRAWSAAVLVGTNPLTGDDHGNPAVMVTNNGYILVVGGCHSTALKYWRSTNPEDISAWTTMSDIATVATYPQFAKSNDGEIYIWYRTTRNGGHWGYKTSTDNGSTWGSFNQVLNNVHNGSSAADGDWYTAFHVDPVIKKIGVVVHEENLEVKIGARRDIWFLERESDGTWDNGINSDSLTLPLTYANMNTCCLVYDSGSTNVRINRNIFDSNGRSNFVFTEYDNSNSLRYVKSTGAVWSVVSQSWIPIIGAIIKKEHGDIVRIYGTYLDKLYGYSTADSGSTWFDYGVLTQTADGENWEGITAFDNSRDLKFMVYPTTDPDVDVYNEDSVKNIRTNNVVLGAGVVFQ